MLAALVEQVVGAVSSDRAVTMELTVSNRLLRVRGSARASPSHLGAARSWDDRFSADEFVVSGRAGHFRPAGRFGS